jgi:hypothetical protein
MPDAAPTFIDELKFLQSHVETHVLQGEEGSMVAVAPAWQGRTMTSATSAEGLSYGWLNHELIRSRRLVPQANLYGGEDRLWIAPEGGQFSFFFEPGAPFEFGNWRCPALIDTEPFDLVEVSSREIICSKTALLKNYSQTKFATRLERKVSILERANIAAALDLQVPDSVRCVVHESQNRMTNVGNEAWSAAKGLPAIWNLGMFNPSDGVTMVVPYRDGAEDELGKIVTSDYFGEVDQSRLQIDHERKLIFFRGDGNFRSKLGLSHQRALPILGSWDDRLGALTIVRFNRPERVDVGYTNNLWRIQDQPFSGDAVNCYNDGPNESGERLGPFYELESLSPALALGPAESYNHVHQTFHFEGERAALSRLSEAVFGVGVSEIARRFQQR